MLLPCHGPVVHSSAHQGRSREREVLVQAQHTQSPSALRQAAIVVGIAIDCCRGARGRDVIT